MMKKEEKLKAVESAISYIERQYGKGSIMRLGEMKSFVDQGGVIPSGSLGLDIALGIGGYPRGRIIEVFGPESSGKTTLALHAIASVQKQGGVCAFIDAEHALDIRYAQKLGVNSDELLVSQPDYGEQALEIMETLVRSKAVDFIVVDSVAALVPKNEIDGDMGDSHVGLHARLMSQACRKVAALTGNNGTSIFFINQLRMKIGTMWGNPETTTGGMALKFYSSIRMEIRRIGPVKSGDKIIGNQTRVKIVKNKLAPPFKQAEFDILYDEGISKLGEILDWGTSEGIIQKSGAWYSYGPHRLGQGRENAKSWLKEHPELAEEIYQKILHAKLPHLRENTNAEEEPNREQPPEKKKNNKKNSAAK